MMLGYTLLKNSNTEDQKVGFNVNKFYTETDMKLSEPFELIVTEINNDAEGLGFGTSLVFGSIR